jgi:hypothetical protein
MPPIGGFNERMRLPTRRQAAHGIGTAVVVGVICWYFGVNVWHAILLGCAAAVASLAVTAASAPEFRDLSWRHRGRSSSGSRNDVATLAYSLRSGWEPIGLTAERRLQQIARRRLALEGLDLSSALHRAAIEQRIGRRAYRILAERGRRPRLGSLVYCLDVLDALDSTHYTPPSPRRRRVPHLIPLNLWRTRER